MGVPMINTCCFCVSLTTGSLIIGYLYTLTALVELFVYGMIVTLRPIPSSSEQETTAKYIFYVASAVVSGIQLLCGILLILGATKRKAFLMLPWTIVVGITAGVYFCLAITGVSLVLQNDTVGEELVMIVVHIVRTCVSVYCIMVVHSLHKQIMNEQIIRGTYRFKLRLTAAARRRGRHETQIAWRWRATGRSCSAAPAVQCSSYISIKFDNHASATIINLSGFYL